MVWNTFGAIGNLAKGNIGNAVGDLLGYDITPGTNLTKSGQFVSNVAPKAQITAPVPTGGEALSGNNVGSNGAVGGSSGGGGGGAAGSYNPGNSAANERALYDDQIAALNSLLGMTNTQMNSGLGRLNSSFNSQSQRLADQKAKTFAGYDQQGVENAQDKQKGVESVDSFANNSFNSLQRLLQGSNAGSSSVARELVPYLVSKSAGTRRQGVFDQAGKNDQAIATARGDAEDQFRFSEEDLGNQRKSQEQQFREGVLNKQNELLNQRRSLEIQKAQANGAGYEAARAAGAASQAGIASRQAQLSGLFSQFNPTFNARALNLQTPELGKFNIDPAQINSDQSMPSESRYYMSQIKKKQSQEGVI